MSRVAKNRRIKRKARLVRRAGEALRAAVDASWKAGGVTVDVDLFAGMPGMVTENPDGSVTYRGDGSVVDCSKTGGVGFSL
jgi:hypothetical protein